MVRTVHRALRPLHRALRRLYRALRRPHRRSILAQPPLRWRCSRAGSSWFADGVARVSDSPESRLGLAIRRP